MGCKLENFNVDTVFKNEELNVDSFNFLELSGRKAMYSRGVYGQGVVVAVIDSGVKPHPEFENRLLNGKNFIKNYGNTSWHDDNMHGTHVAGSIAGKTCGIAPKAEILPLKALDATGSGEWSYIINALNYARLWELNGKKVNIISMSLSSGSGQITKTEKTNLETAINKCVEAGILVVVSAGNTAQNELRYPACFDNVVTVGAVDVEKEIAQFSTYGNHVDVCQVGTKVISAYFDPSQGYEYAELSGTSMSTPLTSGIAALLACDYKMRFKTGIPERKLYEALKMNTKDLGIQGVDKYYGAGFCTLQPLNLTIEVENNSDIVIFNGEPVKLDVPVQIINDRTMFPIREFAERTGGSVDWTPPTPPNYKTKSRYRW